MSAQRVTVSRAENDDEIMEFWLFANEVYAARPVHWRTSSHDVNPLLKGKGPAAEGRSTAAFVARSGGSTVARAASMVDDHYIAHWKEPLGHVVLFEALPGTTEAVRALMDEACLWLRAHGLEAARSGWSGSDVDWPYTVDAYELLPPPAVRQNPPYYHSLLKEARFVAEKGMVDYKIQVTPELVERWERMLQAAEGSGFRVLSFAQADPARLAQDFTSLWEKAFAHHWGTSPGSLAEWEQVFVSTKPIGAHETSVLAYRGDEPVGATICLPDLSAHATLVGHRQLRDEERLNLFGIGVAESARGTGLNLAVAARSFLELVKRGNTHISYTLVVDDNWPSRRTAEKLGASVCGNYLVYRRDLTRTGAR
jgi:RimJ/RimL family protein N-acetyltransferase